MTLFFFLVALELKRELVLGELNNRRMAALSIAGALGGMLVPAALYLMLQAGHPGESGWGTVMARPTLPLSSALWLFWVGAFRKACACSCCRWRSLTTSAPFLLWPSATAVTLTGSRSRWVQLASRSCVP